MQGLVWQLLKEAGTQNVYYPLSFLPEILLWRYTTDENVMLAYIVSLLMALVVIWMYLGCLTRWHRIIYAVIFIPLLYWLAGPVHFVFVGWLVLMGFREGIQKRDIWSSLGILCGAGLLGVACPLLGGIWMQYPLYRLLSGLHYYRFPAVIPWMSIGISALLAVLPFVASAMPVVENTAGQKRKVPLCVLLQMLVLGVGGYIWISVGCEPEKEEAMEYDYLTRYGQWQAVIEKAEKKVPTSPFNVTCLNLALGMTGQLGNRMFRFYQHSTEGLLPSIQRDFTTPLPAGEVYYRLGMINTAQRFTFEAMEANLSYRKSGRCIKRLAETNLINGQYAVAAKYLRMLRKTLFYREWAENAMTYLYKEDKINAHPEWGWLRKVRYSEDFLFSGEEMDTMLTLLLRHNSHNRLAYEYLMAYFMVQRDLQGFVRYYPLGKFIGYEYIPRHHQELLVYAWTREKKALRDMPWNISLQVIREAKDFARDYARSQNRDALRVRYGQTYWNYLLLQ